jgi:hypothetical protein
MLPFKIQVEVNVLQEDIDDILCAALEGGCTHWCSEVKVVGTSEEKYEYASEALTRGYNLVFFEDEYEEEHTLTLDRFKAGLGMYIAKHGWSGDVGDIDAGAADNIIQYALFNEIVYG